MLIVAAFGFAPTASATGQDGTYITMYEQNNYGGDHSKRTKAQGSISTLQNYSDGLFLGCDNVNNNWTNCISSVIMDVKTGSCIVLYDGDNYSTPIRTYWGPQSGGYDFTPGGSLNNKASSIRFGDRVLINGIYQCYGTY
jgi:hypothetical protein